MKRQLYDYEYGGLPLSKELGLIVMNAVALVTVPGNSVLLSSVFVLNIVILGWSMAVDNRKRV